MRQDNRRTAQQNQSVIAGAAAREASIEAAARAYRRSRDLPKLLAAPPGAFCDVSLNARRTIVAKLLRLARNVSRSGRAGHWSYDPNRHVAILGALKAERPGLAHHSARIEEVGARLHAGATPRIST